MKIYSDSTVSRFLTSISKDDKVGFLNNWNASRNHKEQIYISYDSTNKNCQAGDIETVGKNIQYMDSRKYNFVIMVKGMASFVEKIILENKGSFEKSEHM